MDPEIQKVVAMVCLCLVGTIGIIYANCDVFIVGGCAGAIAALGGVAFGQSTITK